MTAGPYAIGIAERETCLRRQSASLGLSRQHILEVGAAIGCRSRPQDRVLDKLSKARRQHAFCDSSDLKGHQERYALENGLN